jgi:hypothetical protein
MPITTNVLSPSPAHARCGRYNIMWPAAGRQFSLGTPVSSTNKTDRHNIAEMVLKVAVTDSGWCERLVHKAIGNNSGCSEHLVHFTVSMIKANMNL